MSDVKLSDLSDEQRAQLKAEAIAEAKSDQKAADAKAAESGEFVYTNALNSILIIPDLGIATPGGAFEAEAFQAYESKDLSQVYDAEELRKSKYLRMLSRTEDGRLVKGKVSRESLEIKANPLVVMARNNPTGVFTDPTSSIEQGKFGTNAYDLKLQELHAKDQREDLETRKS